MPFLIVPKDDSDVLDFSRAIFSASATVNRLTNDASYVAYWVSPPSPTFVPGAIPKQAPAGNKAIIVGDSRISPERSLGREQAYGGLTTGNPVKTARSLINWLRSMSYGAIDIEVDFANHDYSDTVTYPSTGYWPWPPLGYRTLSQGGESLQEQYRRLRPLQAGETVLGTVNLTGASPGIRGTNPGNRLAAAVAAGGNFIIYLCGVNTGRDNTATVGSIRDDATELVGLMKATGLPIIIVSDYPTFSGADFVADNTMWQKQIALRNYYLSRAVKDDPQITVVDSWALLMPAASIATSTQQAPSTHAATMFEDKYLHQNGRGSAAVAKLVLPRLQSWFPDAPDLPTAGRIGLPALNGTPNAATGGASGFAPTGWTATGSNAGPTGGVLAHTYSLTDIVVSMQSTPAVQVVVAGGTVPATGSPAPPYYTRFEHTATGLTAGTYVAQADYELDAGATGLAAVDLHFQVITGDSSKISGDLLWRQSTDYAPDVSCRGRLASGPLVITAETQARIRLRLVFRANETVAATARFANICLVRTN